MIADIFSFLSLIYSLGVFFTFKMLNIGDDIAPKNVCVLECLCKYLRILEGGVGSSGTRVTRGCELPGTGTGAGPLQKVASAFNL